MNFPTADWMTPLMRISGCVAFFLVCQTALAQVAVQPASGGPGAVVTLDRALQRALRFNPEIARLDAAFADKLGRAIDAQLKLNPAFKVTAGRGSDDDGVGGDFGLEIEQPFRPSDFGLRRTYAAALKAAANVEQHADVLRVLNGTAVTFYRAWSLQERAALLGAARAQADEALASVEQQVAAGQINVAQRSILEAEGARISAELLAISGERAGAFAELERATGIRLAGARLAAPNFPPLPSTGALVAFAESRSGIRRIALAQYTAAQKGLAVAKADAVFPEFAPGLETTYGSRGNEAGVAFTIAGQLPIWNRNQGEIVRARGALQAAERELASFDRVGLERSIAARRQQLVNLEARAGAYRNRVIPSYRSAYDATLAQFRAGQATTLQLFEVQKGLVDVQEKSFDYAVEALSARTQLEQLIGGRLEEVSGSRQTQGTSK